MNILSSFLSFPFRNVGISVSHFCGLYLLTQANSGIDYGKNTKTNDGDINSFLYNDSSTTESNQAA